MNNLLFVVHKHNATRLHYDFRLQIGNVMPSWVIAKGPTLDNTKKRLALETTDHSLEYRNFEGVITEGNYGSGPVMIWDEGYYFPEVETKSGVRKKIEDYRQGQKVMQEGLSRGELKFFLLGNKLKGSFALVKVTRFGENAWLLIKHLDDYVKKEYDANNYDFSVVSGKSINEIKEFR